MRTEATWHEQDGKWMVATRHLLPSGSWVRVLRRDGQRKNVRVSWPVAAYNGRFLCYKLPSLTIGALLARKRHARRK